MRHCLSLLIVATLTALPACGGSTDFVCPKNWMKLGAHCYGYFSTPMTFYSAENHCKKEARSQLASIHSKEELCAIVKYVASQKNKKTVWIGLHDPQKKRIFTWIDGTRFNFEAWIPHQPDNLQNQEYCVEMFHQKGQIGWNDRSCSAALPFICQYTPHTKFNGCQ